MKLFLFIAALLLLPSTALALPTPDALISLVNIVPLLTGTAATLTGGFYFTLNRVLGPQAGKIALAILLCLVAIFGSLIYVFNQNSRRDRISEIAIYLRCDQSSHDFSTNWQRIMRENDSRPMWNQHGNFINIYINQIPRMLYNQPDALLIDSSDRLIRHYSGFPAVKMGQTIRPFTHIRAHELSIALANTEAKDIYLYDFPYINRPPEFFDADKTIFKKFDNIYLVHGVKNQHRYTFNNDGQLQPAKIEKIIKWPVENENWIIDEKAIYFPNIATLLSNKKTAKLLDDKNVYLVAPYAKYRRSQNTQEKVYLRKLLKGIDQSRVLSVDMASSNTSKRLDEIAQIIDGKKFMVIGWTKHDWIYEGLDATYELWQKLNQNEERFRLIGFNTRLPEVVALNWEKQLSHGFFESMQEPFWRFLESIHKKTHLGYGVLIFSIAILLRIALFPIGIKEACSRMKKNLINQYTEENSATPWACVTETLMSLTKVSAGWEILGGIITLVLILPAYTILSVPPDDIGKLSFLWIKNLEKPDYILSIIVGVLIYAKLQIGSVSNTKKIFIRLLITVSFTLLLFFLPSSLLVYVSGVLLITLSQDIFAYKSSRATLKRALLH